MLIFMLLVGGSLAHAVDPEEACYNVNVPRMTVAEAINLLARQTGAKILFPYELTRAHQSRAVKGCYTVQKSLDLLLEGSGISSGLSESGALLLSFEQSVVPDDKNREAGDTATADEELNVRGQPMLNNNKNSFLAGIAAFFASITAVSANAQNEDGLAVLEEIVVTAQKREQSYTDVPVSVSVLGGEVLGMAKVTEFQDLVQVSPSLTFNGSGDQRGVGVLIRGIGTTSFHTAVEPTVSTVVDGVVMGRTGQFVSDLNDIERVEVLRGPQGMLFGKNASAGVINIITKRPSDEFAATFDGSTADDDAWGVNATVSGPITDNVRARLTGFSKAYDGYAENLFTGNTINGDESWGVRSKLDIDFSENVNLYLISDYSEQDRDCCAVLQEDVNGNRFYEWDYAQYGATINEKNNVTLDTVDDFSNTETFGFSGELTIDFDNFVLTSITAYRNFELENSQGLDGLPYNTPTYGRFLITSSGAYDGQFTGGNQEQDQFSQEIRVATTAWDNLQLASGVYYWDQSVDRYYERAAILCVAPDAADTGLSPDPAQTPCAFALTPGGYFDSNADSRNWAMFGQAEWTFADRWTLIGGLRYTEDDLSVSFERVTSPGPAVAPSDSDPGESTSESNVSGKVALQYDLSDSSMTYVSYTQGYKAPAYDLIFETTQARLANPVPEETSDAWEAGIKSELFDNRLRLGVTLFHTTFNDLQGQGVDPNIVGFVLTSAGTAITRGVELDFTAKPVPNFLINGGVSYTDAYYDEYTDGQCYPGQTAVLGCVGGFQELSGTQIPNAPEWKAAIQARYDIELNMPINAFVSGAYRYQSDSPGEANLNPRTFRDSYGVVDISLGVEASDGRWNASIFAKNLLDDYYVDQKGTFVLTQGVVHFLSRDAQRYVGLQMEYNFGAM